ncbi:g5865 [Coccomyxa viridis]|uniref:G5865 protein n=1 Tax=Coccomyxa viridis TaxID=1274662 RepID=A0ABP1FV77_9CHLO
MADHAGVYNALIRQSQSDQPQPQQQQQQPRHPTLAVVHPHASCVINCPIEDAWKATREWATFAWLPSVDGREVRGSLLEGGDETSVGAVRSLQIGDQMLFEKLVALDDEEHIMKWKLISHPDTTNPFVASFVNYRCTCRLYPITVGSQTFFDWKGEFYTDPHHVTGMQATWERWYITAFQALQTHVNEQRQKLRRQTSHARDHWDVPGQQQQRPQHQQQQQQPGFVPTSHGMSYSSRPSQMGQPVSMDAEMLSQQFQATSVPSNASDYSGASSELRSELRKANSSSLSTVVSPKSSVVDPASGEGRIPSGGSDFQRRNLSGGSQGAPERDPSHFESYPSLKRGM